MSWTKIVTFAGAMGLCAGAVVTLGVSRGGGSAPASGMNQGIQVDGYWRIEVREPDGTLASEHEFHNRFDGTEWLGRIMARKIGVGYFEIQLRELGGTPSPCGDMDQGCRIREPQTVYSGVDPNDNLLVLEPSLGEPFRISGSAIARVSSSISAVAVDTSVCGVAAPGCEDNFPFPQRTRVSTHSLSQSIQVSSGQQIQVKVSYSFTSAAN